ncbi:MAG: tRNA 2-thiouridine(34) synthase MnmA, partial [Gammaproteobacteria bacterium]|nr:tRNA 2-thiouridine(34) synthase MnmA [Gammaproteobacteria bacterium]
SICDQLDIPLHTANFAAEYWDNVFEHFIEEYKAGRTPNPDILCNKEIKFKAFLDYAIELGADYIATGHYAQRSDDTPTPKLLKGADNNKDQTYFLHAVGGKQIAKTLFPIGAMEKPEVREVAGALKFTNHDKKDSTGICFIGERRFNDFLERYIPAQPGEIITNEGTIIGQHRGLMFYTLGQRQGIGIGGLSDRNEDPWYVVGKELDSNHLVVAQGNNHPMLFSQILYCSKIEWVSGEAPGLPHTCHAKTRYRQADQKCVLKLNDAGTYEITFDDKQRAVTPGQYVVFYDGNCCLGGGVIESTR